MSDFQGIGNYKGLMLCNRPNEEIRVTVEKPFISRVDPKAQLGLNPIKEGKKDKPIRSNQAVLDVLARHKLWLKQFKNKVQGSKAIQEQEQQKKIQQVDKLRQKSLINIDNQKLRNSMNKNLDDEVLVPQVTEDQAINILEGKENEDNNYNNNDDYNYNNNNESNLYNNNSQVSINSNKKQQKNKQKKSKPEWAYTEEQLAQKKEEEEEEEADDLLDFVNNLDYKSYIDDFEVKNMVQALKHKIDTIGNINDAEQEYQQQKIKRQQQQNNNNYETRSQASHQSKQSITSYKEEVINKHKIKTGNKKEWDQSTTADEKKITVQDRLVKHIADEILRNNKFIRNVHSNQSVRTLLENEAQRHLNNKNQQKQQ